VRSARVVVTGASGFVGRHFCAHLERKVGVHVVAVDLVPTRPAGVGVFVRADVGAPKAVAGVLREHAPTHIVHLAGGRGGGDLASAFRGNLRPTVTLLESVREHAPGAIVLVVGSAAEYGDIPRESLPVSETFPCAPTTPYGLAKLLGTQVALHHWRRYGVRAMVVRPFQLLGAGVSSDLAPGAFAARIRAARARGERTVRVGNLETGRDFIDVRDAVRALWRLCRRPAPGEIFNLCSGVATPMRALLEAMLAAAGGEWRVEVDAARLRGAWDVGTSCGSPEKLRAHCGWRPRFPLARSVAALLRPPAGDRRDARATVSRREFPRTATRDGRRTRRRRAAAAAPD
jgi:GDP-4-dehydro-6-deoxy-D-mannose reductase